MPLMDAMPKLKLLIPRLASDNDGEIVATVNAIARTLKSNGADLHDLAAALDGGVKSNPRPNTYQREKPKDDPIRRWREIMDFCLANSEWLSERERTFVNDMDGNLRKWGSPTEKQGNWLMSIFMKLGGEQ